MKKITAIFCAVMALLTSCFITGCDETLPSVDKILVLSKSVGYASGLACNASNITDTDKQAIVTVLQKVETVIPGTNETFQAKWNPIITETVDKLISAGKVTETSRDIVTGAINTAVKGIDYMFTVRWPKAKEQTELVAAALNGFTTGFTAVIKSSTGTLAVGIDKSIADNEDAMREYELAAAWLDINK